MKVEAKSIWDRPKKKPNVYLVIKPETDVDKALMHALYPIKPKFRMLTEGYAILDFYLSGGDK